MDTKRKKNNMQSNRVDLYISPIDGSTQLVIKCTIYDCKRWGGYGICDMCNKEDMFLHLCPELGHKALCVDCFRDHQTRVRDYKEDHEFMLDMIDEFVKCYGLEFSDHDIEMINKYKEGLR